MGCCVDHISDEFDSCTPVIIHVTQFLVFAFHTIYHPSLGTGVTSAPPSSEPFFSPSLSVTVLIMQCHPVPSITQANICQKYPLGKLDDRACLVQPDIPVPDYKKPIVPGHPITPPLHEHHSLPSAGNCLANMSRGVSTGCTTSPNLSPASAGQQNSAVVASVEDAYVPVSDVNSGVTNARLSPKKASTTKQSEIKQRPGDSAIIGGTSVRRSLTNDDRRQVCEYASKNPTVRQADIAAHFGVDRRYSLSDHNVLNSLLKPL